MSLLDRIYDMHPAALASSILILLPTILTTISVLLPTLLILYTLHQRFLHRLSAYPGPLPASLGNLWRIYHELRGDLPQTILALHVAHGPLIRVGPDELSCWAPAYVDAVLRGGRGLVKSAYYDGSGGIKPNVFSTRDEDFHALRRRQMSHGFAAGSFARMEGLFDGHAARMLGNLSQAKGSVELNDVFKLYAQDVNAELSFSQDPGEFLQRDVEVEKGMARYPPMNAYTVMAKCYGYLPGLRAFFNAYGSHIPIIKDVLRKRGMLIGMVIKYSKQEYEKRRVLGVEKSFDTEDKEGRVNLLTSMVLAKDPETGEELGVVDVAGEAMSFIVAGSHSTSAALGFLFAVLVRDADIMRRVQSEIDANAPLGEGLERYANLESGLPYLSALLKEVFRMYPTVNHPLARVTPMDRPTVITDSVIPPGITIGGVAYAVHRNPAIWGPDAHRFRPERWLDEDYRKAKERYLIHFGAGHRACIGRNMALITIWKAMVGILQRYDVVAAEETVGDASHVPMNGRGFADLKDPLEVNLLLRNKT